MKNHRRVHSRGTLEAKMHVAQRDDSPANRADLRRDTLVSSSHHRRHDDVPERHGMANDAERTEHGVFLRPTKQRDLQKSTTRHKLRRPVDRSSSR